MKKVIIRLTESQLTNVVKKILIEDDYQEYLDTNYSSDGMDDYYSDKSNMSIAENLYDIGQKLYNIGRIKEAEKYRLEALQKSSGIWDENDLPPYDN